MSRLFNKNNSSPSLPIPPNLVKSPPLQKKAESLAYVPPLTKASSFRIPSKETPPPSPKLIKNKGPPPKQLPVFGSDLPELLAYDSHENAEQIVPFLVEECIIYLNRDDVLKSEGLFRQSGKSTEVQDVKRSYDAGKYITLANTADPHVITGLLKLYLRSLPFPLIPYTSYDAFIQFQKARGKQDGDIERLRKLIEELPTQNKILLKVLCLLLKRACTFEKSSKMNANSLAIVIGPNIMRSEQMDMMKVMEESPLINYITAALIENSITLFNMPDLATYELEYFVAKRKRTPPVYHSLAEYQVKLEEKKKTRNFLAAFFGKRTKPEDLVKKKIFTDSDVASFRNSRDFGQ